MKHERFALLLSLLLLLGASGLAQVVSPFEISDPLGQKLQTRHLSELRLVASEIEAHQFPYPFYFSRTLDLDQKTQARSEQRSILFTRYEGISVLEITGNYYAAYSEDKFDKNARTKQTFLDVVLPMLQAETTHFRDDDSFAAFAFEISHHVRRKMMGMSAEVAENIAFVLPRESAVKLARAKNAEDQQTALLEGSVYVDAQPFLLWLSDQQPDEKTKEKILESAIAREHPEENGETNNNVPEALRKDAPIVSSRLINGGPTWPVKKGEPPDVDAMNAKYSDELGRLAQALEPDAHLASYAPPTFIDFRNVAFLQLSMTSTLENGSAGSQYRLAALAFDQHIAHLVRPVLGKLPKDIAFGGVDFSTTVKVPGKDDAVSVEFLVPLNVMRCYADYECTGQQLINASIVLINGERATLDLLRAEAETPR